MNDLKNLIPYWVGVAESAAEAIAFWQNIVSENEGKGYPAGDRMQAALDKAKASHREAMENIIRINSEAYFPFDQAQVGE